MKGTPRPVSLKTDVIKHRNRSKGDRKSAKEREAMNNASGTSTPTTSTAGGSKKKNSAGSANKASRQGSLAPSTASSVIREEEMEGDDGEDASFLAGNKSIAASTDGGDSTMLSTTTNEAEHAQKKPRTSLDHLHNRPSAYSTPLTPAQLQAQQAAYNAAASRRPANATHPHHPYNFYPAPHSHHNSPYGNADKEAARSGRARELAAAFALANASGAGNNATGARRTVSVDGRSTPTSTQGHSQPIPWNIASYFNGMAERERQNKANSTANLSSTHHSNLSSVNNSRANTASQPNSAPSSATVSPTGTTLHEPPTSQSQSQTQQQQQQQAAKAAAAAQAQLQANLNPPIPPYQPHPHTNFLAAYRARQMQAASTSSSPYTNISEEYQKAKAEREKLEKERLDREKEIAKSKETISTGGTTTTTNGPHKEWSPLVVSRTDPRLANLNSGSTYASAQSEAARMAQLAGWRPPSSLAQRDTVASSSSRHASPANTPGGKNGSTTGETRSASTSRAGSRHNSPPHSSTTPTIHPHPPIGATRLLFGLPTVHPRAASSDRYNTARHNGPPPGSAASGVGYPGAIRNFDNMTEEDREKQKARLDQLFAAAGQRLSAAQQQQSQQSVKNANGVTDSTSSALSTPTIKDLTSASAESAVGRSPANTHHNSYRPYDLNHRSSSRAASINAHSSAPNSGILGPRASPNHLTSSLNLGKNAIDKRLGSPNSHSSPEDRDESNNGSTVASLQRYWSGDGKNGIDPELENAVPFSKSRKVREDGMALDEVDEDDYMALEDQEGLDDLPNLRNTTSILGHRDPASQSPPFGITFGNPPSSASERRGRSTTRKMRDGVMGEDDALAHQVGDHVAHELGALRVRDSSRSSSQIRSNSRSPDRNLKLASTNTSFPELPRFSHLSQMAHAQAMSGYPRSSIHTSDLDDGIVKNALTHRPISDLRASASPHPTLPSLSEALSSSTSSRSLSASHTGSSRHSSAARTAISHRGIMDEAAAVGSGAILPPPNFGYDESARLRTRVQELEFINGLMEARVAELENTITGNPEKAGVTILAPHGPNCSCRCSEIDSESLKAAEHLKKELLIHGVGGIGEQASRDLLDLLAHRLGYKGGASASSASAKSQSPAGSGSYPIT